MGFKLSISVVAFLLLISGIGVGLAYSTTLIIDGNLINSSSEYCEISTDSTGVSIVGNDIVFEHSMESDEQCTITYSHHSVNPQSGIISIDVVISSPDVSITSTVISMISGGDVVGSTELVGTGGTIKGSISGIGPIKNNNSMSFSLELPPDVIFSSGTSIMLMFEIIPMGVSE